MGSIRYMAGDATRPVSGGSRVIAHICNNHGRWGSGFTGAISSRWESPERFYRQWYRAGVYEGTSFQLGATQFIDVGYNPEKTEDRGIWIANMVAQDGFKSARNPRPVCYESLKTCLGTLYKKAVDLQAEVIMPRIGTGRGGGDWKDVEFIIKGELIHHDILVSVYHFRDWI
jgi:O-acetyl-ADP-ribose deacetylase (regulator of RNase III)